MGVGSGVGRAEARRAFAAGDPGRGSQGLRGARVHRRLPQRDHPRVGPDQGRLLLPLPLEAGARARRDRGPGRARSSATSPRRSGTSPGRSTASTRCREPSCGSTRRGEGGAELAQAGRRAQPRRGDPRGGVRRPSDVDPFGRGRLPRGAGRGRDPRGPGPRPPRRGRDRRVHRSTDDLRAVRRRRPRAARRGADRRDAAGDRQRIGREIADDVRRDRRRGPRRGLRHLDAPRPTRAERC